MNELCISGARVRGKVDMERDIQRSIEAEPKEQEPKEQASKPAWVLASCCGTEWRWCVRDVGWHFSLGRKSTLLGELSTPGPDKHKLSPKAWGSGSRGGPLSLLGGPDLRDLVCFWVLGRDKYPTGRVLGIFYIINNLLRL